MYFLLKCMKIRTIKNSDEILYRISDCFKSLTISTALIAQATEFNIFEEKKIGICLNYSCFKNGLYDSYFHKSFLLHV